MFLIPGHRPEPHLDVRTDRRLSKIAQAVARNLAAAHAERIETPVRVRGVPLAYQEVNVSNFEQIVAQ
jgi:hypothetical protein